MCVVLKLPFHTLKSLINEQGGYVVFLVLSEYSFIRDFRVVGKSEANLGKDFKGNMR